MKGFVRFFFLIRKKIMKFFWKTVFRLLVGSPFVPLPFLPFSPSHFFILQPFFSCLRESSYNVRKIFWVGQKTLENHIGQFFLSVFFFQSPHFRFRSFYPVLLRCMPFSRGGAEKFLVNFSTFQIVHGKSIQFSIFDLLLFVVCFPGGRWEQVGEKEKRWQMQWGDNREGKKKGSLQAKKKKLYSM